MGWLIQGAGVAVGGGQLGAGDVRRGRHFFHVGVFMLNQECDSEVAQHSEQEDDVNARHECLKMLV